MSQARSIRTIRDLEISGKRLFLRLDFNVPLSDADEHGHRKVEDDSRIQEALTTIRYAVEKGARIIIASHLGRPKGKKNPEYSLEPAATHLAQLLNQDVTLADDCIGEGIELMAQGLKNGQILMLENLRFYKEEEANDSAFAHKLARLADVYVTDAFGTAHRKHASTYGLPAIMAERGMGFLIEKELKFLDPLLKNPAKPYYAVLGGAKVSDKIKTIESLLRLIDGLLVGGAMAYAFTSAKGEAVPPQAKQPSAADVEAAKSILREAKRREVPVLLPSDTVDSFDIGPKTVQAFSEFLKKGKTIFWNGPLGWFEKDQYSHGTFNVAQALAEISAVKVVGGGDTVSAIKQSGVAEKFDHLSTGGGAVLEYLEGDGLPGIDILKSGSTRPGQLDLEA
jgi:phosphoglycerate kinase